MWNCSDLGNTSANVEFVQQLSEELISSEEHLWRASSFEDVATTTTHAKVVATVPMRFEADMSPAAWWASWADAFHMIVTWSLEVASGVL